MIKLTYRGVVRKLELNSLHEEPFLETWFATIPVDPPTECKFTVGEVKVLVTQSCLTLCDPMDYSPPGSSVHGVLQVRILRWAAIPFSKGSSWPKDGTWVSCIAGGLFTIWATRSGF